MIGQVPYLQEVLVRGTFHQQMSWAKKEKRAFAANTQIQNSCCVTGSCLGHTLGSREGTDTCKTLEEEEIMHWQSRMLNCAAETKQALTRMPSEAPTKHIFNVKAIPASHWESWLDDHYLRTVMEIYRQQERGLKEGKWKDVKITTKQKSEHWKGGGEDFDRNSLTETEGEREQERKRERDGRGWTGSVKSSGDLSG